jgi:hypothetical protein
MSDDLEEIVENIKKPSAWIRIIFVLLFAIALHVVFVPLVIILSIAQALFSVFTGDSNANLKYVAATLELYIAQILKYISYNSEQKPFPFSSFPEANEDIPDPEDESNKAPHAVEKKKTASRKKAVKKSASKKPSPTKDSDSDAEVEGES